MEWVYKVVVGMDDYFFNSWAEAHEFATLALVGNKDRQRVTIIILRQEETEHEEE